MSDLHEYSYGRRVANDEPGHRPGCEVQMIEKNGEEATGLCDCVEGCAHRERSIELGRELAEEHGW